MTFTSAISGIIVSVTSCGKQGNMSRMTLSDRIEIEAGIYARKSLSEIAERIHKSRRHVSEELRRNATKIPGEHPLGKRCRNATGCRQGGLCGKENCHRMCYTCKEVDCQTVCKARTMTLLARSCRNHPTSAMFAADAENARPTERTTPLSKQMLWQSVGTQRPETSHRCKRKRWQLWMLW